MSHLSNYLPISARIKSLSDAAIVSAQLANGFYKVPRLQAKVLAGEAYKISQQIAHFFRCYHATLPLAASAIDAESQDLHATIARVNDDPINNIELTGTNIIELQVLDSRILHALSSSQERLVSLTERALQHLQWTILCDETVRGKWQAAFGSGELDCEKLGMVHLLWHGIFAFKTDGGKARSDLVAGEITREATAAAEGLVLTEWKLLHKEKPEKILAKALTQAKAYKSGHLGGTELHEVRYIVLVSEKQQSMPIDVVDGGIVYRYINISVDPYTLSKAAAKTG